MSRAEDSSGDVWAEAVAEQEQTDQHATPAVPGEPGPQEHAPVAAAEEVAETGSGGRDGAEGQPPLGADLPFGTELGPLVDEVRRFASTVSEKVTSLSSGQSDPMEVLQNLAAPLRSKSPAVYGHLLAAGGELIAAYRAAVSASERRWAAPKQNGAEHIDLD